MCGRLLPPRDQEQPGLVARVSERAFDRMLARVPAHAALGVGPPGDDPAHRGRDARGYDLALRDRAQGLPAATGYGRRWSPSPRPPRASPSRASATLQQQLAEIVERDPAVSGVVSFVGAGTINATPNAGRLTIALKPLSERDSATAVIDRLQRAVADIPGITVFIQPVQDIQIGTRISRTQFQYTLMDTDPAELALWAPRLLHAAPECAGSCAMSRATSRTAVFAPISASIVPPRCAWAVSMQAVQDVLYDAFGQRQISTIFGQANQYRRGPGGGPELAGRPVFAAQLRVPGSNGAQVPLSGIAHIERTTAPLVITHQEQFPSVTLSFNLAPGYSLGERGARGRGGGTRIGMPPTISGTLFRRRGGVPAFARERALADPRRRGGDLHRARRAVRELRSTRSRSSPRCRRPAIGALLALMLFGTDLSLVALVGIVLLMGIVKKNAIMMIDFAIDAERERGLTPLAAIEEACLLRFRPIMMTTMAALLGALPLVLEHGPGRSCAGRSA